MVPLGGAGLTPNGNYLPLGCGFGAGLGAAAGVGLPKSDMGVPPGGGPPGLTPNGNGAGAEDLD